MLDNETKRRIDTARDILVGKVPDPKSQVEQITIALIYKFMDDMDKKSIDNGGKPSFFVGEYERYSWSNIFDPRLGGAEMLNLYSEAITKLSQCPSLPQLFRNIFKNAYLPYRDPETLKLFLKTINEFTYDHSERLGDAYEYLLSVLSSQGDAGQFRTPRHIIDFIVEIVDPQKNETILDPACGTAGFLISSYKHIIKQNTKNNPGDLLTTKERKELYEHFKGYDISPDMVRLALVNMYLHRFVKPQIIEYDTLTSEDHWNEYADVILANPPFMSPKGGIRPHKKFSVKSNRSEVLFVDYIAEHLTPTGRAGVIVPEGIIFQSANAYKQLRKILVENYLFAVVSLPAGIFNPYSGVKTSILLMDKQLAKKTDSILFVKIENDGFDLGAQRRPIDKNNLPDAIKVILEWKKQILNKDGKTDKEDTSISSKLLNDYVEKGFALIVKKEKIAENGDYNLTGERYRIIERKGKQKWKMVRLGEVCEIENGSREKGGAVDQGIFSIGGEQINEDGSINFDKMRFVSKDYYSEMNRGKLKYGDVLMVKDGATTGKTAFWNYFYEAAVNEHVYIFRGNNNIISYFLFKLLQSNGFQEVLKPYIKGIIGGISLEVENIQIPLPPLEVQKEIVGEIEGYQKIIDGCKQVVDNWKPDIERYLEEELEKFNKDRQDLQDKSLNLNERENTSCPPSPSLSKPLDFWPMVKLGDVCEIENGSREKGGAVEQGIFSIGGEQINEDGSINFDKMRFVSKDYYSEMNRGKLKYGDVLMVKDGATTGKTAFWNYSYKAAVNEHVYILRAKYNIIDYFLFRLLQSKRFQEILKPYIKGIIGGISLEISEIQIPLPPLEVQKSIVERIETERKVVDGCRELIKIYEQKIKRAIDSVWGD